MKILKEHLYQYCFEFMCISWKLAYCLQHYDEMMVQLNTELDNSLPNILNTSFEAAEGESIQLYLDAEGIIVSTGSACASGDIKPSHVLMAKSHDAEVAHSSIRFSFGLDNTKEDIEKVMNVLPGIIDRLQQISTIERKK
jgi:cysteine desulfurase